MRPSLMNPVLKNLSLQFLLGAKECIIISYFPSLGISVFFFLLTQSILKHDISKKILKMCLFLYVEWLNLSVGY